MVSSFTFTAVLVGLVSVSSGEKYTLNFEESGPFVGNQQGERILQQKVDCKPAGSRLVCETETVHGSRTSNGTEASALVTANLNCIFSPESQVDFRRARGCSCSAMVVNDGAPAKPCGCTLCPSGYGTNPINIDCDVENATDPFVLNTCSSFDCGNNCNGTCNLGCENPTPECAPLCNTAAPTSAPTGFDPSSSRSVAVTGSLVLAATAVIFSLL